jgi:hypothetical protein
MIRTNFNSFTVAIMNLLRNTCVHGDHGNISIVVVILLFNECNFTDITSGIRVALSLVLCIVFVFLTFSLSSHCLSPWLII